MRKKIFKMSIVLLSLLLILALVACSNNSQQANSPSSTAQNNSNNYQVGSSDPVEITFFGAQYSNATEPFLRKLVDDFEDENSDIKVNLELAGWDVIGQRVTTMITTNQTPDILNFNSYSAFVEDDLLAPIEEIISPELKNKFYNSFYSEGSVDGTQYSVPFLASIRGLYYNKDLFEQAGISNPPTTWEELEETALKIKEKTGVDGLGIHMTNMEGQSQFSYFIWGNGGYWKEGDQWTLNNPKNVEGIEFMKKLVDVGATNPEPTAINRDDLQRVFGSGRVAMLITANFLPTLLESQNPDLNYGVAGIPSNGGQYKTNLGVQDFLMVFNSTKHPEAVGRFLDFLYEDGRYEEFMKAEGMLPATETVGKSMAAQNELTASFISQLDYAKFYPFKDPKFTQLRLETIYAVQQVLLGEKTAQEALDELQQKAEQ